MQDHDAAHRRYRLFGSIGSPYALKLRSLLRYKRLPFDWLPATLDWIPGDLPHPPLCASAGKEIARLHPRVVPAIYFPGDGSIRNESTVLAYALDQAHPARPIIPSDPGLAFLSHLLEDMADEWLVKIAFQYRWGNAQDAAHKSRIVSGEFLGGGYERSILVEAARHFAQRQQSRMPLVGCTPDNVAMIVESFRRLLALMDRLMTGTTFIFGACPTLADFGFYGQLQSLATDPTSWAVMRDLAPGVFPYLQLLEDASGIEPTKLDADEPCEPTLGLLRFAASFYLPYLEANERGLMSGLDTFAFRAEGLDFRQAPFRYHAKCYRWLKEEFEALPEGARARTSELLERAGALGYFQADGARRSA
jgi:glutathione S-transferase